MESAGRNEPGGISQRNLNQLLTKHDYRAIIKAWNETQHTKGEEQYDR